MKNKAKMIDFIYNKVANKSLTFGCEIKIRKPSQKEGIVKNIGHPVMIGDVLDYIEKEKSLHRTGLFLWEIAREIIKVWKDKTKPIEDQSIECIKYIYNLIK